MAPILRAVGRKRGMLMVLSRRAGLRAGGASTWGSSAEWWPAASLDAEVKALAAELAGLSPTALGLAKEAAATSIEMDYGGALRYLRELTTLVFLSDDAREGVKAFFEKRTPRWTGH